MDQAVQLCCSQSFVPRALFGIVTEPRTASNSSSFVVIFPGMVFKISVRFFLIILVAPIIFTHFHSSLYILSFIYLSSHFLRQPPIKYDKVRKLNGP